MSSKKKKEKFEDDGRVIANMDFEHITGYKSRKHRENRQAIKEARLSRKERFAIYVGAFKQYMPIFGKKLVATHIHDNSGVFNADNHLIPFDGKFDFDRFARQINESGYTGSLMLEVMKGHCPKFYDDLTDDEYLQKAANAIKKLRAMVDGE